MSSLSSITSESGEPGSRLPLESDKVEWRLGTPADTWSQERRCSGRIANDSWDPSLSLILQATPAMCPRSPGATGEAIKPVIMARYVGTLSDSF